MSGLQQSVMNVLHTPRTATTVAGATLTTGVSTMLEWLPNSIGELASLVGVILSFVLIYVHLRKSNREVKESAIKIEILRLKKQAIERGLALKRVDDNDDEIEG